MDSETTTSPRAAARDAAGFRWGLVLPGCVVSLISCVLALLGWRWSVAVLAALIVVGLVGLVRCRGIAGFPRSVVTSAAVLGPCVALAAVGAGSFSATYVLGRGLEHLNGLATLDIALIIAPQPVCFALLAGPAVRLLGVVTVPGSLAIGSGLLVAGLVALVLGGGLAAPTWLLILSMASIGAALACTLPVAVIAAISATPERDRGSATGLTTSVLIISGVLGTALVTVVGLVPSAGAAHSVGAPFLFHVAMLCSAVMVLVGGVVALVVDRRSSTDPAVR